MACLRIKESRKQTTKKKKKKKKEQKTAIPDPYQLLKQTKILNERNLERLFGSNKSSISES